MPRSGSKSRAASGDDGPKGAFIYCRVSSEEQSRENHHSLHFQEEHCRAYAKHHGFHVAKIRKDVGSGKDTSRSGYQELLQDIESHVVDVVIVYRLDRLSRSVRDLYDFIHRTSQAGIGFASTSEAFEATSAMGRAMLGVAAVFAQLHREITAENVRDGMARRARLGKYTGPTNNPRYGYAYSKEEGKLLVDPNEAEVVRQVFELFARQKWGVARIALYLNHQGIPSRTKRQWSTVQIRAMLKSPVYIGKLPYKGQVYDGQHEPIITPELFEGAQELIRQRAPLPARSHQSQHLLSGLARCGRCDRRLQAHWVNYLHDPSRKSYRSYGHGRNQYTDERACPGIAKSADKLEELVVQAIREVSLGGDLLDQAFGEARRELATVPPSARQQQAELSSKLAELSERFDRWAERLDAGEIDEEQFRARNAALLQEKAAIQAQVTALAAREAEAEAVEVGIAEMRHTLQDFGRVWEQMTVDEQRELLRGIVESLRIWKDRAELTLHYVPTIVIPLAFRRGPQAKPDSRRSKQRAKATQ